MSPIDIDIAALGTMDYITIPPTDPEAPSQYKQCIVIGCGDKSGQFNGTKCRKCGAPIPPATALRSAVPNAMAYGSLLQDDTLGYAKTNEIEDFGFAAFMS